MTNKSIFILLLSVSLATSAFSAQAAVHPIVAKQQIGITLSEVPWPDTLQKDLSSGLENRILLRTTLTADATPVATVDVVLTEKYDLWDEQYYLKIKVGDREAGTKTAKQAQEMLGSLSTLSVEGLFGIGADSASKSFVVSVDILINPVSREKMEKLNDWIARNSTPQLTGANATGSRRSGRQNTLFNSIYDQYVHGADVVAPWKITLLSTPFTLPLAKRE